LDNFTWFFEVQELSVEIRIDFNVVLIG